MSAEMWSLERLCLLIPAPLVTSMQPYSPTGAVVVLQWDGEQYLMDGRRRINHWKRVAEEGPHRVLVLRKTRDI